MSSIEQKLNELAALATQLEEAKKTDPANVQVADGEDRDVEDADKDGDASEVKPEPKEKADTSDEPEGNKGKSEIEMDDTEVEDKKKMKTESQKIDLGALFDGQELSEDFKLKTVAVFEAAVETRVAQEVAELKESLVQDALNEAKVQEESLVEKVDGYLDYMVEQWMENNALALGRGVKTEILESFVGGMKELFESHYIDVPDEKYDLVEASQSEVAELAQKLDEAVEENISLRASLKETARLIQIEEAVDGLVETDAEKFRELAESLSYTNEDEFAKKLVGIRESYFKKSTTPVVESKKEEFITDAPVQLSESVEKLDPTMERYMIAIRGGL
jgi:hypothetical protein